MKEATQAFIQAALSTDWQEWQGISVDYNLSEITNHLPGLSETSKQDLLGMGHVPTDYHAFQREGHPGESRVWMRGEKLLMLDLKTPKPEASPEAILEAMGEPEGTMEFFEGMMDYADGAKVYASKGICLFLSRGNRAVLRVLFFAPTDYETYYGEIAPYMHSGDRIGNRF